ncbi:MAG: membrane protein insertion efficiency factor YidD [Pseudomonadota bacterium]
MCCDHDPQDETWRQIRDEPQQVTLAAAPAVALIRFYQLTLSHVFAFFGVRCRHAPTCSEYALLSFQRFGLWRGFWLTLSRLLRCHPFGSHGIDPPPDVLPDHGWRFWRYGDWAWTPRGPNVE